MQAGGIAERALTWAQARVIHEHGSWLSHRLNKLPPALLQNALTQCVTVRLYWYSFTRLARTAL